MADPEASSEPIGRKYINRTCLQVLEGVLQTEERNTSLVLKDTEVEGDHRDGGCLDNNVHECSSDEQLTSK